MNEVYIDAFIRAVDKKYSSSFINNGEIYLNTISWFREIEKIDSNRGDSFENIEFACASGISMSVKSIDKDEPFQKITDNGSNFKVYRNDINACVYCLYCVFTHESIIEDNKYCHYLDEKYIEEFSSCDFFAIINPISFLERLKTSLTAHENVVCYDFDLVTYYPYNQSLIKTSPFHKREIYSYQKEFRLYITLKNDNPIKLYLGNLKDIIIPIDPTIHKALKYEK